MQPGDTITPGQEPAQEQPDAPETHDVQPVGETANDAPVMDAPSQVEQADPPAQPEATSWQYNADNEATQNNQPAPAPINVDPVIWTASEFMDHEKSTSWFLGLAAITITVVALIYFITHDLITVVGIIVAAILFGAVANRKPRVLQYNLDMSGLNIGGKLYEYDLFKSFSVLEEGAFHSIQLLPLKRFMPPVSIYYPPEQEDQVVGTLGSYLPHEERSHDPIDRLMSKVRF